MIDYDEVARLAEENKPKMIIAGASAYARVIDFKRFREIADSVGAILLVDMAHYSGLIAGGVYPNPCEHAHIVTSTTHKTLRGPRSGLILAEERFAKDIDRNVFPGAQGGPLVHVIAAKATCFLEAMQPEFKVYVQNVLSNAKVLASGLQSEGFRIISGGTDSHIVLMDVFSKGVKGKEAEAALDRAHITVNKNAIPFDVNPPLNPSGIRLGTAALTTRGFGNAEFEQVARLIAEVLADPASEDRSAAVRKRVHALTQGFPLYSWRLAPASVG